MSQVDECEEKWDEATEETEDEHINIHPVPINNLHSNKQQLTCYMYKLARCTKLSSLTAICNTYHEDDVVGLCVSFVTVQWLNHTTTTNNNNNDNDNNNNDKHDNDNNHSTSNNDNWTK